VRIILLLKLVIKGSANDLRDLLCKTLGCNKPQPKVRLLVVAFGPDEPIPLKKMKLTKPIKPGFRRPFTITPDEPVDAQADGNFYHVETVAGDSTVTYDPTSTATSLKGWLNGDGATGEKAIRIVADGHNEVPGEPEREQPVSLDVEFTVNTPDATSLAAFVEGADEPIPTP